MPGVGGAPDPRRRAVRGELPRWYTCSGPRPHGGMTAVQACWTGARGGHTPAPERERHEATAQPGGARHAPLQTGVT